MHLPYFSGGYSLSLVNSILEMPLVSFMSCIPTATDSVYILIISCLNWFSNWSLSFFSPQTSLSSIWLPKSPFWNSVLIMLFSDSNNFWWMRSTSCMKSKFLHYLTATNLQPQFHQLSSRIHSSILYYSKLPIMLCVPTSACTLCFCLEMTSDLSFTQ